jgi:hypothetical protein
VEGCPFCGTGIIPRIADQLDTVFTIDDERLAASQTPQIAHFRFVLSEHCYKFRRVPNDCMIISIRYACPARLKTSERGFH